jgi:hypothetical protein
MNSRPIRITLVLNRAQSRMVSIGTVEEMRRLDPRVTFKGRPWGAGTVIRCTLQAATALIWDIRRHEPEAAEELAKAAHTAVNIARWGRPA